MSRTLSSVLQMRAHPSASRAATSLLPSIRWGSRETASRHKEHVDAMWKHTLQNSRARPVPHADFTAARDRRADRSLSYEEVAQ